MSDEKSLEEKLGMKPGLKLPDPEDRRPKRFYDKAEAGEGGEAGEGWTVRLDGRLLRTPKREPVLLPTKALAEAMAQEWTEQGERIDPALMPVTRLAFVTLDRDASGDAAAVAEAAKYAGTDLVCYRAEEPADLVAAQAEAWDPVIAWVKDRFGFDFAVAAGLLPVDQPETAIEGVRGYAAQLDRWALTGFVQTVATSGSALIALMLMEGGIDAERAYALSRIDETHQEALWGQDEEAAERAEAVKLELLGAGRFIAALKA